MADRYVPTELPLEYDSAFFAEELRRISAQLHEMELPYLRLVAQHVEPAKLFHGLVVDADGVNWNPGHGAGIYHYEDDAWVPLFPLTTGIVTARVHVVNTITETTIYTNTIPANQLSLDESIRLTLAGYYDTDAASDTWTLRVKLGGITIHTITRASGNNATDFGWELVFIGTLRTIGASGTLIDSAKLLDEVSVAMSNDSTVHSVDTTIDNDLVVTIQWGAAKAGNDFHLDLGFLEALH